MPITQRYVFSPILKHSFSLITGAAISIVLLSLPACVKAQLSDKTVGSTVETKPADGTKGLTAKAGPPAGTKGWTKSFEDTFSKGFDSKKWNTTFAWGTGYINDTSVSYYSPNNVSASGGHLTLKANNNREGGLSYTGGLVNTYGKFYQTYGYFEARVKVTQGNGLVPYFSLLAEDKSWPPEINIFEIPGFRSENGTKVWMTNHYKDESGNPTIANSQGAWISPVGLDQDYHIYGLLWQPGLLAWYVDGVERYRTTVGVPNKDNYITLCLGVFYDIGTHYWGGDPAKTTFPKSMTVSWVRAWKKSNG